VLSAKNVTFRFAARDPPNYKNGWTLKEAGPVDLKSNIVKLVVTSKLIKMGRIQLKSVVSTGLGLQYILSGSDNSTSFKGYILP